MAPLVIFRADAAPAMGGGHVQRCLALAEALAGAGWRSVFACRAPTLETVPALGTSPHDLILIDGTEEKEPSLLSARLGSACDLLVVDHYGRGRTFERECRAFAARIMAIEDQPGREHDCDLLLDPTPGRSAADYARLVPGHCKLLLGPSYALLRGQFAQARQAVLARRSRGMEPARIFVSLGMTDPQNLTAAVLNGISISGTRLAVDVVIGSAAPHLGALRQLIDALKLDARVHVDSNNIADLMGAADIAVGAAGSSSFERCCLGLPSLIVVAADNQRDIAAALIQSGAAEELDQGNIARAVAAALRRLCGDALARVAMAQAAAKLCDGEGTGRVTAELFTPAQAK
jgi:UDP-2,4-diacetamido-2,4,6-trideoxy-beta-L-altropyranose hydrolase